MQDLQVMRLEQLLLRSTARPLRVASVELIALFFVGTAAEDVEDNGLVQEVCTHMHEHCTYDVCMNTEQM